MKRQSLLRWCGSSLTSSSTRHVTRVRSNISGFILVFLLSVLIRPASSAQLPSQPSPGKQSTQKILVKIRPALAQQLEAALPAQGPVLAMTIQPGQPGNAGVQSFLGRYSPQSLAPLYPGIIRLRQIHGWSDAQLADQIRQRFAARARRRAAQIATPEISRTYVLDFGSASPATVEAILRRLKADPEVEFAEPQHTFTTNDLPNDPFLSSTGTWGQTYPDLWGLYKIAAPTAWNTAKGDGIIVAVVDTGIDYNHPDIAANIWVNTGEIAGNGIDDDGNGFVDDVRGWDFVGHDNDPIDHFGHGTHVAGIIAAVGDNGIGVIGVAWHAQVMAVKGLGDNGTGDDSTLAPAIIYAANNGADVINASWGGQGSSQTIEDAIQFAYGLGVVFVAAAGNSSEDALNFFPANSPEAITVAASDPNDQFASFSDFGSKIDVAAPGVDVLSLQASGTALGPPPSPTTTGYVRLSGTSMATPHVSGTAALILSQNSGYSVEQVRQVIRSSTDDAGAAGYDLNFGYGRLNAATALTVTSPLEAKIQAIQFGAGVSDPVTITGFAQGAGFASYILELGAGALPASWTTIVTSSKPVPPSGTLGALDPTNLAAGTYTVRLTAVNATGGAFVDRKQFQQTTSAITSPVPPRFPTSATTFKPGAIIPVLGTALNPGFQNFVVEWASGINPVSGWQTTGITLTGGGLTQIRNSQLAAWDTSSITQAGYFTIRLTVNGAAPTQTTTSVYLEPDLLSVGWPLFVDQGPYFSAGVVPAANPDGTPRLIMASPNVGANLADLWTFTPDGAFQKIPLQSFGSHAQPAVANLDGIAGDEAVLADNNVVDVFHPDNSFDTFTPSPSAFFVNAPLLLEDLAGDGHLEAVAVGSDFANDQLAYVFAWRPDGTPLNGNFPIQIKDQNTLNSWFNHVRVLAGDFLGDGNKEIVVQEGLTSNTYTLRIFAHDGTPLTWQAPVLTGIPFAMAAADLDHNGKLETILFNNNGSSSAVHVFQADGTERTGWPVTVPDPNQFAEAFFAVGDFRRDGHEEIVFSHETSLYLFNSDGTLFSNAWPLTTGVLGYGSAVIGDIDGDGFPEIVITRTDFVSSTYYDAKLLAIRSDGTTAKSWQLTGSNGFDQYAYPQPAIGDFNQDGTTDIAVAYEVTGPGTEIPGVVTILTTGAPFNPSGNDWPMSLQNPRNTDVLARGAASSLGLTLTSGTNPSTFGSTLTFTASVTPNNAIGNVNLLDGGNTIAGPVALQNGTATFTLSSLGAGAHSITAHYSGGGGFAASTSSPVSQNVTPATLTVTADNASRAYGAANPTFTGTITGAVNGDTFTETFSTAATAGSPVGSYAIIPGATGADLANYTVSPVNGTLTVTPVTLTVTANNASRAFGAANPAFSGTMTGAVNGDTFTETFSTSATPGSPVGNYAIVPGASGANVTNYTVSPVNGTLAVVKAGSAATLASSNASVNAGVPVTFTAAIASATSGEPTGAVQFFDGSSALGTVPLNAQGIAALTTSALSSGVHAITAQYGGDSNFNGSTSPALAQNIMDFTVAASPSTATIKAGSSATFTFSVTPLGGFNQTISFSCSGLPAESQCSFAPPSVTPNGGTVSNTLTITTTAPSASLLAPPGKRSSLPLYASLLGGLTGLMWITLGTKKRRTGGAGILVGVMMLAAIAGLSSCGGGGTPPPHNPGTPPGTSTVSVTTSAGADSHAASITLTVTQ